MKRLSAPAVLLAGLLLFLLSPVCQAYNPLAHIFIVDAVYPGSTDKLDLYYGSIAPDIALYADPAKWPTAFVDTHYTYIDLSPYAWTSSQKAFANGWRTHNELWGADWYAHGTPPSYNGYVNLKADELRVLKGLPPEYLPFMHFTVETAIDVLLSRDHPDLVTKLLAANLLRSPLDRSVLTWVLVWKERKTDWATLTAAEVTFRGLVGRYAMALALLSPLDKQALAQLGVQLAEERYGMSGLSTDLLLALLDDAIELCSPDYMTNINAAIGGIDQQTGP